MSDDRQRRIEQLFDQAVEQPAEQRAAFVRERCEGDETLAREVRSLLDHFERASGEFLASPAPRHDPAPLPSQVGPYRILELLGEGGFGIVYVADQTEPVRRRVALKILKAGMDTRAVLARFEAERQALALMDHPSIAKVLDAGATEAGRPYFVMELVKGDPLTTYAERAELSLRARIQLFLSVCYAVQHAHQKGIIHRDLKPSNILVTVVDARPVPKVIDFGVAKATATPLTDKTIHTLHGQVLGTPMYMSPEQAELTAIDVDTTTDVYSLGVILYELLTGSLPHRREDLLRDGIAGLSQTLRRTDPPPPSSHDAALRGDLDWIVMRAMEKERTRRYQGANLLALDLERYLADQPIEAGPPSTAYRLRKFARRHRVVLGAATAIGLGVLGAAGGLAIALFESNRQRAIAESALDDAQRARNESEAVTRFLANMLGAVGPEARGQDVTVRQVLDQASGAVAREFEGQPLVEAHLRTTIGATYREIGLHEEAERHLVAAHASRERLLGPEAPATLSSLRELGELHGQRNDFAAAESLFTTVLRGRERSLGVDDPATIAALVDLAGSLQLQERDAEAIPLLERALATPLTRLGPDAEERVNAIAGLALSFASTGRYEEADSLYRAAVDGQRRRHGDEHVQTLAAEQNLASLLRTRGRYDEARGLYEHSVAGARQALGESHPTTLRYAGNLALLYSDAREFARAESLTTRVLDAKRRVYGEENPSTLATGINLALLHARRDDHAACLRESQRVHEIARRVLGAEHTHTLSARSLLGMSRLALGQPEEAERDLRAVLDARRAAPSAPPWRLGQALSHHGAALLALGRLDEAESALLEGHRILRAELGADHPQTALATERVRELFARSGRPDRLSNWEGSASR